MKHVNHPTNQTIDELLKLKLENLINQRERLNQEINRIEHAMGMKLKPMGDAKKKTSLKISVKDVRNAIISYSKKKNDFFELNEVKRQYFPNEFNSLTTKDRIKMTSVFSSAISGLKTKDLVMSKQHHPGGKGNERLFFIKEEAQLEVIKEK